MREIQIDSDATFLDFNNAILESCSYTNDQITTFHICKNGWEKAQEIAIEDIDSSYDEDTYVMADTRLSDLLEEEKQHLLFTYDIFADRVFFIELSEIITRKSLDKPEVSRSIGSAPKQILDFAEQAKRDPIVSSSDYVDDDMTSDSFSDEDIAMEGLDYSDEF